jgi:beta-galactosidase beta subunit
VVAVEHARENSSAVCREKRRGTRRRFVPNDVLNLRAGEFTIFFPEDSPAPGLECAGVMEVRQAVSKVRS